jgi:hypothetical protein
VHLDFVPRSVHLLKVTKTSTSNPICAAMLITWFSSFLSEYDVVRGCSLFLFGLESRSSSYSMSSLYLFIRSWSQRLYFFHGMLWIFIYLFILWTKIFWNHSPWCTCLYIAFVQDTLMHITIKVWTQDIMDLHLGLNHQTISRYS